MSRVLPTDDDESTHADQNTLSLRSIWCRVLPPLLLVTFTIDFAQHGIAMISTFFLEHLGFGSFFASTISRDVFGYVAHLSPLLGAYLADCSYGRYGAFVRGNTMGISGLFLMWLSTWKSISNNFAIIVFLFGLLGGMAFGGGLVRPTIAPLGLDQFTSSALSTPAANNNNARDTFLSISYMLSEIAGTLAIPLSSIALNGVSSSMLPTITKEDGFYAAFAIPCILPVIGFAAFLTCFSGIRLPPQGSNLTELIRRIKKDSTKMKLAGVLAIVSFIVVNAALIIQNSFARKIISSVGLLLISSLLFVLVRIGSTTKNYSLLDSSDYDEVEGKAIEDLRAFKRILGILPYCVIQKAGSYVSRSTFGLQACQMNQVLFGYKLPPAVFFGPIYPWLNIIITLFFLLLRKGISWTPTAINSLRISFATLPLAFLLATAVELWRRALPLQDGDAGVSSCSVTSQSDDGDILQVRRLSIIWFLPQIVFVGIAEYCYYVGSTYLFYSEVPSSMRTLGSSLGLLAFSFGALLSTAINLLLIKLVPKNLDNGHLEYIYLLMVAILVMTMILFSKSSIIKELDNEMGYGDDIRDRGENHIREDSENGSENIIREDSEDDTSDRGDVELDDSEEANFQDIN